MSPAPSRRSFVTLTGTAALAGLVTGLATGLAGCLRRGRSPVAAPLPLASAEGPGSLKVHAAARGIFYGCAVDQARLANDQAYAGLVRRQAAMLTSTSVMQWATIRPAQDRYDFTAADALIAFAEAHGQQVHGQTLCGAAPLPAWFDSQATPANARLWLTEHIARTAGRYAGRMHSWDVVGGAIHVPDGRSDGLRETPWLRLVGEDYLEAAFRSAREADPQSLLAYRDFGLLTDDKAAHEKRIAVLVLLRRLRARHVPVDAVGLESRLMAGDVLSPELPAFLAAVRELGMQIFVEDFAFAAPAGDAALTLPTPAPNATRVLDVLLHERAVDVVLSRGLEAVPQAGLPFDENATPTPAFFALRAAFDRAGLR